MKKICIATAILFLAAASAYATPFVPTLLKLSAPQNVQYDFDGSILKVPVTVAGTPSYTIFCVYTNGKADQITGVTNGHLGWHYVNKIDTSIFIASPIQLPTGTGEIQWNGRDDDGNIVPSGSYTYYLFGYDNYSGKKVVNQYIMAKGGSGGKLVHVQETGPDGKPLANPVWYGRYGKDKWIIGSDPADSALIETTTFTLPTGYNTALAIALQPDDQTRFFIRTGSNADRAQTVTKMIRVPNGESTIDTDWGERGQVTWTGAGNGTYHAGPDLVGDYLYTTNNNYQDKSNASATLYVIDWHDGTMSREIDLTPWWSSLDDMNLGGLLNGGPNGVNDRNGYLFLNCHCSCLKQMVNPSADSDEDFIVWTNKNGDYVLDHNFAEDSQHKWACNDLTVGPYTYHVSADQYLFNIYPAYDMGAVSFGMIGPDGDGIGYFPFANDTSAWKWFNHIVDSGSAYDGIYCDNQEVSPDPMSGKADVPGIYYIANDSMKGIISNQIGVKEDAPAAFTVTQNTPNPFNPTTTISFTLAKAGKTTVDVYNVAGQKISTLVNGSLSAGSHSVVWNARNASAGVYFYTVKSGDFSKTMKMTLLK